VRPGAALDLREVGLADGLPQFILDGADHFLLGHLAIVAAQGALHLAEIAEFLSELHIAIRHNYIAYCNSCQDPISGIIEGVPEAPLVSIVTPALNMGRFLEQTIQSVLSQDYPNIEYIVMDGGSSDETLAILRQYEDRLEYQSRPDAGAADAINQGFARSHGEIFAYLNADDTYRPGALRTAVQQLLSDPGLGVVYGEATWIGEAGEELRPYGAKAFDSALLREECFISQPAAFMRREAFELAGRLDPNLHFAFDYDLWIRIARVYKMRKIDATLANSRMHKQNKTIGQRKAMLRETLQVLRRHYGYVPFRQIHTYTSYLVDGRDQFFEPLRPSLFKYVLSCPVGLLYNIRRPFRYFREWARVMSLAGMLRTWRRFSGKSAGR